MTKKNIYQKLHDACLSAKGVKKGAKANGMHFNPLLHDDVQAVATQALLDNGLYATCNYLTEIVPNIKQVMVVCTMRVYDVDDPTQHILVDGCSAFGNLDKFGTGNAMSYSRKYAFLNLLNLKTGVKDEDGYEPKPFEDSTEQSVEEPTFTDIPNMSQGTAVITCDFIFCVRPKTTTNDIIIFFIAFNWFLKPVHNKVIEVFKNLIHQ